MKSRWVICPAFSDRVAARSPQSELQEHVLELGAALGQPVDDGHVELLQVSVPMMADQPANAALMAAAGVGITLDASSFDADGVRAAVGTAVFDEAPRAAARRVQDEIRALPTPAETVPRLQELVARAA
jgi:hypothetical protein